MALGFWNRNKKRSAETEAMLMEAAEYLKDRPKVVWNPYPEYEPAIMNVLGSLECDIHYPSHYEKLKDKAIESLSLREIATMYTRMLRGERFCDGFIAENIEDGTLYRLVLRHAELLRK